MQGKRLKAMRKDLTRTKKAAGGFTDKFLLLRGAKLGVKKPLSETHVDSLGGKESYCGFRLCLDCVPGYIQLLSIIGTADRIDGSEISVGAANTW